MNLTRASLWYAIAVIAFLTLNRPGVAAQPALRLTASAAETIAANAYQAPDYHISVSLLPSCIDFGCEKPLSEKNAIVSEDGQALPVRVERLSGNNSGNAAPVPVHVLIAFAQGAPRLPDAEILMSLRRIFSAGWRVSVMRADGTFTPYCDRLCLARELGPQSNPATSVGDDTSATEKAIDHLDREAGLRLLLVETQKGVHSTVPAWAKQAAGRLDAVYAIDGGETFTHPDCGTPGGPDTGGPLCSGTISKTVREYSDGVIHEVSWSKAVNHLVSDRKYDYDLHFSLPETPGSAGRPVTLILRDTYSLGPGKVNAELYAVAPASENGGQGGIRNDPRLKLMVVMPPQYPAPGSFAVTFALPR
ncbi:MAG TPA: hypothetical protein VKB38_02785 [Terracidiphilus sp.]|nr:hypothetical protein [Terracidiphilus sp.]